MGEVLWECGCGTVLGEGIHNHPSRFGPAGEQAAAMFWALLRAQTGAGLPPGVRVTCCIGRTVPPVCSEHRNVGALLKQLRSLRTEQFRLDFRSPGCDSYSRVKTDNGLRVPRTIVENNVQLNALSGREAPSRAP